MVGLQSPFQAQYPTNTNGVIGQNDWSWTTEGQGTISYPFAGIGFSPSGFAGTTLTANISATATGIPIANASVLNNGNGLATSALPTWVLISSGYGSQSFEMIRITACTSVATSSACVASTTAATLTVAYDGRGMSGNVNGSPNPVAAQPWLSGAAVGEFRIQGTGTAFSTDANRAMCPAGVPGPTGQVAYSTGTVTLTASSTTLTGSGTTWTSAMTGYYVYLTGATHGGTPFTFWRQITAFVSTTQLTMDHAAPSDVDGTAFSYVLTSPLYLSLEMNAPSDGHVMRLIYNGMGCESDTAMFAVPDHDIPSLDGTMQPTGSAIHHSYKILTSAYNGGGFFPEFYGGGCLPELNFYLRSGYTPALSAATTVCQNWPRDPQIGDGYAGGDPLVQGGAAVASMVYMALFPSNGVLAWDNVEAFAGSSTGIFTNYPNCNALDTRETGYVSAWTTLAANWDTNATNAAIYTGYLGSLLARAQTCRRNASDGYVGAEVNSFANSFDWAPQGPVTLTNGSTAVTGTGVTVTMTNGRSTFTVASGTLTNQALIYITDTTVSPPYVGVYSYSVSGSSGQLGGVWPGGTGTFSAQSAGGNSYGIWTSNQDWPTVSAAQALINNQALERAWSCIYNNSTSLTLNRPWDNTSGSSYYISNYNVGVFGQQPFFYGILTNQARWGTFSANSATASGYAALLPQLGNWFNSYGYDSPNNHGTFYNSVFQACYPNNAPAAGTFAYIHTSGGCDIAGLAAGSASQERVDSVEGGSAMIQFYLANQTPVGRAIVDAFYGAIFAYPPYCAASVAATCADGQYAQPNSMSSYKWPGFYFGMGGFFVNSWPAVRNGIQPTHKRTEYIGVNLGGAASALITVTAPSGMVSTVSCSTSPCEITVDDRQGSYLYQVQRLSSSGQVLSTSEPVLLPQAPQP
jgi:hypothetical protein